MRINRRVRFVIFVLWMLLIFAVSSWPSLQSPEIGIIGVDKIAHFTQYFIAGILLALYLKSKQTVMKIIIVRFTLLALFCIVDEIHQLWIPGRSVSIYDAIANLSGIFFSLLISLYGLKRLCYKKN